MDHMKEGDEPRFTTSALTAPTSRETSRTFAPRRHYLPRGSYLNFNFHFAFSSRDSRLRVQRVGVKPHSGTAQSVANFTSQRSFC